ncbi:MAG: hypothetical protein F6K58_21825 [Symploca sp. SIO2E9]|nr:hypothetical protein [Symploca sp. SIO2E9]
MVSNKKPETIEELEAWLENRKDHGKINGEPIIQTGTTEIRSGFVPGNLYDEVLLIGAAIGFNKSQIGTHALLKFLASPTKEMLQDKLLELGSYEAHSEFRAYIPTSLYELAVAVREQLSWNNSQLMTVSLSLFVNDLGIKEVYRQFLDKKSEETGLTTQEIEQKIFDCWRYQAREKRLELSRQRGEFVSDRKLP